MSKCHTDLLVNAPAAGVCWTDTVWLIEVYTHPSAQGLKREGAPFVKSVHSWGPWTCLVLRLLRLCLTDLHGDPTQLFHSQHKKFLQGWADKLTSHGPQRCRMSPVFMARHCQRRISQSQHRLISMFEIRYCLIMFLFCFCYVFGFVWMEPPISTYIPSHTPHIHRCNHVCRQTERELYRYTVPIID